MKPEELEQFLSDPVKWARKQEEIKAIKIEDIQIDYQRKLEDLNNQYELKFKQAYLELVEAGLIKRGDTPPWLINA